MEQTASLLNILTYKLPGIVTLPLFMEYNNRLREINNILAWEESSYRVLGDYQTVVESLLAMSLFYRHVLGHIQGATSFYKTVNSRNGRDNESAVKLGRYILDKTQQNYLLAAVISFNEIQVKYQLYPTFYEFSETSQFLKNCINLLNIGEHEEDDPI